MSKESVYNKAEDNAGGKKVENKMESPLEDVFNLIKAEFSDADKIKLGFKIFGDRAYLSIEFSEEPGMIYVDQNRVVDVNIKIDRILMENNLEVDQMSTGPRFRKYRINQKFINGKINWRRWLPYPENFKEENKALLDEVSTFREFDDAISESDNDSLGKFTMFVRLARQKGLINDEEKRRIEMQYNQVAHP